MKLSDLLHDVPSAQIKGNGDLEIDSLTYDSRQAQNNSLFFVMSGQNFKGEKFIPEALNRGAKAFVSQSDYNTFQAMQVRVKDTREAMAAISRRFYSYPDQKLKIVGVTGTNGKTTTAFLVQYLLQTQGLKCGLIGTVHYDLGNQIKPATHTTPESCDLYALLHEIVAAGCQAAVMEVSSHALDQKRVFGIDFDVAVFTNLSRDHLDYHKTMESYFRAKAHLFSSLNQQTKKGFMVLNGDDPKGRELAENFSQKPSLIYSSKQGGLRWEIVDWKVTGCLARFSYYEQSAEVLFPLFGRFNLMNAAAALGVGLVLGGDFLSLVQALAQAPSVPGRLERIPNSYGIQIFVDYAHTDDALRNVLETLREIPHQKLLTVFGCGGDRDRSKRPLMGAVASELSDEVFVTTDNPRTEDPAAILKEIQIGLKPHVPSHFILDRKEAIFQAIRTAREGDIVLIAGKGHETYQEIKGVRSAFDDKIIAQEALEEVCNP